MSEKQPKIVLLIGNDRYSRFLYNYLSRHFDLQAVIIEDPVSKMQLVKRRMKKLGYFTVLGQLAFQFIVPRLLKKSTSGREHFLLHHYNLDDSPIENSKLIHVPSVNNLHTIEKLQQLNPDLVVVNGTRIISKKVLEAIDAPFINTHAGITPQYRGVHGGYWALANDDQQNCGVTIHFVDKGIDTGSIISQHIITPGSEDNFTTYPLHQLGTALPHLKNAIENILMGNITTQNPLRSNSQLWYHPTLWQYIYNRIHKKIK